MKEVFHQTNLINSDQENVWSEEEFLRLIEEGDRNSISSYLNNFKDLNTEVALKLIEVGKGEYVASNLYEFEGLNAEVALKLMKEGEGGSVASHLNQFKDLNTEVAFKLIEAGKGEYVAYNLKKFQELNHQEIALKLIEAGKGEYVAYNLKKFQELNHQEIALKLIEAGVGGSVASNLYEFEGLNHQEIALKLIEAGVGGSVASNLDQFEGLNHQEIALKLIEAGVGGSVASNLDQFEGLNHQEIALKLIEAGVGGSVASNLDQFEGLNHQEIALKLIEAGKGDYVASNLYEFEGLNHQEIAIKLIEAGKWNYVDSNLNKFQGLNHQEIAIKLIEAGKGEYVASNLYNFEGLNAEVALKLMKEGEGESVISNLDKFKFSPDKLYFQAKDIFPDFIGEIVSKFPRLAESLEKSPESLILILKYHDNFSEIENVIKQNPFLLEALEENARYGSKLILKYPEFDDIAQTKIENLYNYKKEILLENTNLDPNSAEFRKMIQEKLISFGNNSKIISNLNDKNVNSETWLNYDKPLHFSLGEEEDVRFSDKIKTPIIRIKDVLGKYQESISRTLVDYKPELLVAFLPNLEAIDIQQKIAELKERITNEQDLKKAQGMERGLASLEQKEKALKPANAWDRVQSDIFRLKSMVENIFKFHDLCLVHELKLESIKDRKELIKEKDKLAKNKVQLRENFQEFEIFFDSYSAKLEELIAPILGTERSSALLQEIKEKSGEDLNHYDTDKNTLQNIFRSENSDNNTLEHREMSVSIASRNPDRDLYLGNYCPCCVCIESGYHGEESPIADYVSDLGMQNIVVYDEKLEIPVVVCWAFIGENKGNGEPILVIDNIEANTNYTSSYPKQLKEKITEFVEDYAQASNIKTIIQGKFNNDLIVFPLAEIDCKLGNLYNRPTGYYLESERDENEDEDDEWLTDDED